MRKLGRQSKLRLGYQADAVTPATTGFFYPTFYGFTPPPDPGIQDDPMLGGSLYNGRDPTEGIRELEGGELRITAPLDLNMMGHWLRMLLGAGVQSGSNPNYVHTFESGKAALPYVTIEHQIASGDFARFEGCMLNSFSISYAKAVAFQRIELTFRSRRTIYGSAFLAGTEASALTELKVPQSRGLAKWNNAQMGDLLGLQLNFSNNVEAYNTMSGDNFPLEVDPGFVSLSGSMRLRTRDNTYRAISAANSVDDLIALISHASDATNRLFQLTMPQTRLSAQGASVDGPGGIEESINFQSEQIISGSPSAALIAVLKNGQASSVYGY